jgi:hypothetical protein
VLRAVLVGSCERSDARPPMKAFWPCAESPGCPRSPDERNPRRQQRYPDGVAVFGVLFASALVLVALCLAFVWMVVARDGRLAILVAALGAVLAVIGITALAGTCLSYQARPSPRPPVGPALVWRSTAAVRAELVLSLLGITILGVSAATLGATPLVIAAVPVWLFGV